MIDTILEGDYFWPKHFPDKNKTLFLDIETTGLSSRRDGIYLIGVAKYDSEKWHLLQWFSRRPSEEQKILSEAMEVIADAENIISFNGATFDIPFINSALKQYDMDQLEESNQIDLYKKLKVYKELLNIPNCKQYTLEKVVGIDRGNDLSGGELVKKYEAFVKGDRSIDEEIFLSHNAYDIKGMLSVLTIFSINNFFEANFEVADSNQNGDMLLLNVKSECVLPFEIELKTDDILLKAYSHDLNLCIKCNDNRIKLYYQNYRDYYYLFVEDRAIHKSIAGFVDSQYRKKATYDTCYSWEPIDNCLSQQGLSVYLDALFKHYKLK